MKKISILMVLLCTACAYSRPLYTDEQGQMVYEASCDGSALSLGDCYKKAKEDCPNGFNVKDRASSEWAASRNLIYVCKNFKYQNNQRSNTNMQYYRYR